MGSKGQNSTSSEHGHAAYQIKANHEMQQHGSKYFASRPHYFPLDPNGWGKKVKIQLFQNMVMLHIKLKGILLTLPQNPGDGVKRSKIQLFQNMVMLHIKLNGLTKCRNMVANILPADAYQFKVNQKCRNMAANILPADPPPPHTHTHTGDGAIGQSSTLSEHGQVAYHIKGNYEI